MRVHRTDLAYIGLLLLLQLLFFPLPSFNASNILASSNSDVITQYLPHQLFIRQTVVENGSLPFWNPYELSGTPTFPNPLYPILAFPHILLTPLPPALAINMGFILHIFLAGLFTYAFVRLIGCTRFSALFAAIVFSVGTRSFLNIQAGFYAKTIFFAYIPLLFLCCELCIKEPGLRSSTLLAISMTLGLLTGIYQLLIYAFPLLMIYFVLRVALKPESMPVVGNPRTATVSALSTIPLFCLLSAFYLIPALKLYPLLTRYSATGSIQFSLMPSFSSIRVALNPMLLNEFSRSNVLPWECALYIGLMPVMLIVFAFFNQKARRDLYLWGILIVVALLFSIKELKYIHMPLNEILPVLETFRNPGRMLYFVPFFAAVLAAKCLQSVISYNIETRNYRNWRFWLCLLLIGTVLITVAIYSSHIQSADTLAQNYLARFSSFFGSQQLNLNAEELFVKAKAFKKSLLHSLIFQFVILITLCGAFMSWSRGKLTTQKLKVIIVLITFLDLLYFGRIYCETKPLKEIYPDTFIYNTLKQQKGNPRLLDMSIPQRAGFWTAFPYYQSAELKISRVCGYSPVNLSSYTNYIDRMTGVAGDFPRWEITASSIKDYDLFAFLNTEYLISEPPLPRRHFKLIKAFNDVPTYRQFLGAQTIPKLFLYRYTKSLPRAWLIPVDEALREGTSLTATRSNLSYRPIQVTAYSPNLIEIELETDRPSYLVLSEILAPGWTATDNELPVEFLKANGIFRSLFLDEGNHKINIRYRPPGLTTGLLISILTVVCTVAAIVTAGLKGRRASG